MANQRGTFAKRNREMKLKDRAKEKAERRARKADQPAGTKGPQIAWDEAGGTENAAIVDSNPRPVTPSPSSSSSSSSSTSSSSSSSSTSSRPSSGSNDVDR